MTALSDVFSMRFFYVILIDHSVLQCGINTLMAQKLLYLFYWHPLVNALIAFVAIDYITGVMCAVSDKTLSSEVGFKGICRKVLIFLLVGIGNIIDVAVLGAPGVLRTAVIFFYLSNEGVSLLENAAHLGLPVPEAIKTVLEQLHDKSEKGEC